MEKFKAKYINENEIEVFFEFSTRDENKKFTLVIDGIASEVLSIKNKIILSDGISYILSCSPIELGHRLQVADEQYNKVVLDIRPVCDFKDFDDKFYYDGNDLGSFYKKESTRFALWAPLCSQVNLVIRGDKYHMKRSDKGVYRFKLKGDYDGEPYYYEVVINDVLKTVTDPYGIGSTSNSKYSVVINKEKIKYDLKNDNLPVLNNYCDSIIYELSIRDFTSSEDTTIKHKSKYLGLCEIGTKNKFGDSVGIDYLKNLGITHVQLMPIFDFFTIDEDNPKSRYNWGYDPRQYNVPEGSYSTSSSDPYARILELKKMISALHEFGIKVNMDVVYNHVYAYEYSVFETIVPNYYFRKKSDGSISNGSFCGNDFDSTRLMARKFILDSVKFWMEEYGIDGFRFDLMSIIDIDTMRQIVKLTRSIKPDCMLYGEGWNVPTALHDDKKTSIMNAFMIPEIGFFNDLYRDSLKGGSMDNMMNDRGYLLDNGYLRGAFKYAYRGSVIKTSHPNIFNDANQSINYIECHDNATLFDKLYACFQNEEEYDLLRRIRFINAVHIFSLGVPFIHMGQEIGLSKKGITNSYNSGDEINQFHYELLHDRKWLLNHFIDAIKLRKMHPLLRISNAETIKKTVSFYNLNDGGVIIRLSNKDIEEKDVLICINPSNKTIYYPLDDYYRVIFNEAGIISDELFVKSLSISKENVIVLRQN